MIILSLKIHDLAGYQAAGKQINHDKTSKASNHSQRASVRPSGASLIVYV